MRRFVFMMPVFCSLPLSWLLALRLVVLHLLILLLRCHLPHLRLFLLLLVVRVVVFIMLTVVTMVMWRHSAKGRRKLRLVILHRVLVVLVLEDLRGVLLVQRHRRFLCGFYVDMSYWYCDSVLCAYRFYYCFSVFHFGTTYRSFSRYLFLVS
jgi:hypothetical protein